MSTFGSKLHTAGEDVVKVAEYLPKECIKIEHLLQDAIAAEPDVKAGVLNLLQDVENAESAIVPLIGPNGLSIGADLAAFAKLQTLFADFKAFLPLAEKVYGEVKADLS